MRSTAQWLAAWALLPEEWRRAIEEFCLRIDSDVAAAALKIDAMRDSLAAV